MADLLDAWRDLIVGRDLEQWRYETLTWLIQWSGHAKPPDRKQAPPRPDTLKDPRRKEFRFGDP